MESRDEGSRQDLDKFQVSLEVKSVFSMKAALAVEIVRASPFHHPQLWPVHRHQRSGTGRESEEGHEKFPVVLEVKMGFEMRLDVDEPAVELKSAIAVKLGRLPLFAHQFRG